MNPQAARLPPRRGTARGSPGAEVHLSTGVHGPAGIITLTAVTGTVTAVTGTPGRLIRPRIPVPFPRRQARGLPGTAGASITGAASTITLRAVPGTVQAVTGTPGHAARSRTRMPGQRRYGRGNPGTAGVSVTGSSGLISVRGTAGGISVTVTGTPGTVAAAGPAGFVVLTPYRYTRWDIDRGFSCTAPRSHIVTGNGGEITVKAVPGIVTATQGTEGTPGSAGRIIRPRILLPLRRGKAQ